MIIAIFGATGNMMIKSISGILNIDNSIKIRILTRSASSKKVKELIRKHQNRIEVIEGSINNKSDVEKMVDHATYVINAAATIPPLSEKNPAMSHKVNMEGAKNVVDAIKEFSPDAALIHISTVAIYGNRNYKHPFGRVGDPLLVSPYDCYGSDKLKGERYVVLSGLKKWAVIRQTGMLYSNIIMGNIRDGLMFQTPLNVPIEWTTDIESASLMVNIIKGDLSGNADDFWDDIYSLGGGAKSRVTGYETFQTGFSLMGGDARKFLSPSWHARGNFHCFWFLDSDVLEDMFHFRCESFSEFFKRAARENPIIGCGKFVPPFLIKKLLFSRLLNDENAPKRWLKDGDIGRINACFGSVEKALSISDSWDSFPLLCNNQNPDTGEYLNYEELKDPDKAIKLSHGWDEDYKAITYSVIKEAAAFRGLSIVSSPFTSTAGEDILHTKMTFRCSSCNSEFFLTPFALLKGGYGCPSCSEGNPWREDLINRYPFYEQVWLDSHSEDERERRYGLS